MMLRPTSTSENSSRGNTAYGESAGYFKPNIASAGAHDVRGDVARIALYTYVRWGNTGKMWGTSGVIESKEVLIKWMKEDPVDTWELGRNDSVEAITGTRNVFVDYPELAFELFEVEVPSNYTSPSGAGAKYGTVSPDTPDNNDQNTGDDSGNTTTPDNSGSNTNQNTGSNQNANTNQNAGSNQNANTNQNAGSNQNANTNQNADSNQEAPVVDTPEGDTTVEETPSSEEVDKDTQASAEDDKKDDAAAENDEEKDDKEDKGGIDMMVVFGIMLVVGIVALVALIISDKKGKKTDN